MELPLAGSLLKNLKAMGILNNEIMCQAVTLAVKSQYLSLTPWELYLQNILHSVCTLLLTLTNSSMHEL